MILNEISLTTINESQTIVKNQISVFLNICHDLFQKKKDKVFYYTKDILSEPLGEDYSLYKWLADSTVLQKEKTYFRTLLNRGVLLEGSQFLENEVLIKINGKEVSAIGCLAAYEWEDYVVSFPSDKLWMNEFIRGVYLDIEEDDKEISVRNCSTEEHIDKLIVEQKRKDRLLISSGKELWDKREELFPHLIFCEAVRKQLEEARVSLHIGAIIERIQVLEDYFATYSGDFEKEKVGYGCRFESDSVQTDARLKNMRKFKTPYGNEEYFYWHISFPGNYPGRIHFIPDSEHNIGIIGYIGKHLPTKKYSTI